MGIAVLLSVPCFTLILGWYYPYKSLERGGSDSRIGEHSGQLAAHIPLEHGNSRCSHRIVFCRSVFVGGALHPCLAEMDRRFYGLYWSFDKGVLLHVCHVSVWSMLHSFISVAPWFLFFVAIEHLGELQLAVANILRSISTLFLSSSIRLQPQLARW